MTHRSNTSDSKPFYRRTTTDTTNLDKFKYLHKNVLNKESSSIASSSEVVDALKQLAEYLIWEDKNNEDSIFEYFCEENIMDYMTGVLCRSSSRAIRIQLVQTISMLIHNITNKRTLYYLLSNNYINGLITVPEMYSGGDVSSWTISLLKTLSSILNKSTIKFFFLQKNEVFPLLDRSLIFLNSHDSMKRAHVMTIILNIFKVKDDDVVDYIIHKSKILLQLVLYLKYCWYRLNKYINKYYKFDENILIECDDILCFIEELMDLEIVSINQKLVYYIFNICFIPLIKKVLRRSSVNLLSLSSLSVPDRVDLEYLNNVYYQLSSSVGLAHLYITNKTNLYNNFSDTNVNNERLLTEPLLNEHKEEYNKEEDHREKENKEETNNKENNKEKENENNKNKNTEEKQRDEEEKEEDYDNEESMKVELDDNDNGNELVNNVIYYIIVNVLINCRRKELLKPLLLVFFSPFISRKLLVQLGGGSRNSSMVTTPIRTPASNRNDNKEENKNKENNNEQEKEEERDEEKENENVEKEELFTSSTRTFAINQDNINAYYSLLQFLEYYDLVTEEEDKDNKEKNRNTENNKEGEKTPRLVLDDDCVVNVVMGVFIYDGLCSLKVKDSKLLMLLKLLLHYQFQLVKMDSYKNDNKDNDKENKNKENKEKENTENNNNKDKKEEEETENRDEEDTSTSETKERNYGSYQNNRSESDRMKELLVVRSLLCNNNIFLQVFNAISSNVTNYKLNVVLLKLYNSLIKGYIVDLSGNNNTDNNKEKDNNKEEKEQEDNRNKNKDKKQMILEQQLRDELRFHLDIIYNIIRLYVLNSIESTTLFYLSVFYSEWIKYVKLNYTNIHNLIHYNDILPLPNEDYDNEESMKVELDDRENPLNMYVEQVDKKENENKLEKKPTKLFKERNKEKLVKRLFSRGNKKIIEKNSTISNTSSIEKEEYKYSPIDIFKRYIQILLLFKELYNILKKDNSKSLNDRVYLKSIEDASLYLYEACPLFYNHLEILYLGNKPIKLGNLIKLNNIDGLRYYKCIIRNNNDQRERVFLVNDIFFILAKVKVRKEHRHERKEREEDKHREVNDHREEDKEDLSSTFQSLLLGGISESSNYVPVSKEDFVIKEEKDHKEREDNNKEKENEKKEDDHREKENKEETNNKENNKENKQKLALEITCVHFLWNCLVKKVDKANFKFNILISWHPNYKSLTPSHYYSNSNNKWNDPITPIVSEFEIIFSSLQDLNAVLKLHNDNKKNLSSTCLLSLQDYLYN